MRSLVFVAVILAVGFGWPARSVAAPTGKIVERNFLQERALRIVRKLAFQCEPYARLAKCAAGGRLARYWQPKIAITILTEPNLSGFPSKSEVRVRGLFEKYISEVNAVIGDRLHVGGGNQITVYVGGQRYLSEMIRLGARFGLIEKSATSLISDVAEENTCLIHQTTVAKNGYLAMESALVAANFDASERCVAEALLIGLGLNIHHLSYEGAVFNHPPQRPGGEPLSLSSDAKLALSVMYHPRMTKAVVRSREATENRVRRLIYGREVELPLD